MPTYAVSRKHGKVVGMLFYFGFLLLFCALGTFGSAVVIAHQGQVARSKWTATAARLESCAVDAHERGTVYSLHCAITYQFAGRRYSNSISSHFTRSVQQRSEFSEWVASNRPGATLALMVNPSYPSEFIVLSHLPFRRGYNADNFAWAAVLLGGVSFLLLAAGRKLARRGW